MNIINFNSSISYLLIIIAYTNKIVYQKISLPPRTNYAQMLTGATCHGDKRRTTQYKILQQKENILRLGSD